MATAQRWLLRKLSAGQAFDQPRPQLAGPSEAEGPPCKPGPTQAVTRSANTVGYFARIVIGTVALALSPAESTTVTARL